MRALLLPFLILFCAIATAQQHNCGTQGSPSPYTGKTIPKSHKKNIASIAVIFHNVSTSQVDNSITTSKLENEIYWVNRYFEGVGIDFFMCGAERSIRGNQMYNYTSALRLDARHHVPNAINIYLVEELETNDSDPICGYAYYPWQLTRRTRHVTLQKSCLDNGRLLAHELGHFFGLRHTHDFDNGREYVDRSNCTSAGDGFCDTPADPRLGYDNVVGCVYVGDAKDALNKPYDPDVSNLMSYAPTDCQNSFSEEQTNFMSYIEQEANSYLRKECEVFPDFKISTSLNSITSRSDEILEIPLLLEHEDLNINQQIEVQLTLNDNDDQKRVILGTEVVTMQPGESFIELDYQLKLPLNTSSKQYLLTAKIDPEGKILETHKDNNQTWFTLRINNSDLEDQVLYPNPTNGSLRLFLRENSINQDIKITISDTYGRQLYSKDYFKNGTELFIEVDVSFLETGLYTLNADYLDQSTSNSFKFVKQN